MYDTIFMEKSYVIASILLTKKIHRLEEFVTMEECNVISNVLQQEFNKKENVVITDTIDNEYYKIVDGVIFINKNNGFDFESIMHRYQGYLLTRFKVILILWNDEFIYKQLLDMRK